MKEKMKEMFLSKEYLEADEATQKIMWLNLFMLIFILVGGWIVLWHKIDSICGIGESKDVDDYDFDEEF